MKPIPEQYKEQSEALIHEIGQLADKLWAFVTELGDSVEIECGKCKVVISKRMYYRDNGSNCGSK